MSKRASVLSALVLSLIILTGSRSQGAEGSDGAPEAIVAKTVKGEVIGAYDNAEFLLKSGDEYLVVHIGKEHWDLGIGRGNEVEVEGVMRANSPLGNDLDAKKVKKTSSRRASEPRLALQSANDILGRGVTAELAAVRGKIEQVLHQRVRLTDKTGSIVVDLGSTAARETYRFGMDVVVIGKVVQATVGREIKAVYVRPVMAFRRPGEPATAEKVSSVLKRQPMGKIVKAQGRISLFIGEATSTILYDGKDILIVYRSEKYLSLNAPGGEEVEVVGVFDVETHDGKEYGVLREARIDRAVMVGQLAP